jgi:diphosphomevalonate decarboxylase
MKNKVISYAPINIALCKYWGKKDDKKVLPFTSSISITLKDLYTKTTITKSDNGLFEFYLNGVKQELETRHKILRFCKLFYYQEPKITIHSINKVPTSAGLASSASGFAALAVALNAFYETNYSLDELVALTRKGSGSAVRSLMDGFVHWKTNGNIEKISTAPSDLVVFAVVIDPNEKYISSTEAMKIGVETSPFYSEFVLENQLIANQMIDAFEPYDFNKIGVLMEQSTTLMHKVMETSNPKIVYQKKASRKLIKIIKNLRESGLTAYTTMDAGPNVKIFTREKDKQNIESVLKENEYNDYYILYPGGKAEVIRSE